MMSIFSVRNCIHIAQKLRGLLAHHNQPIGEMCNLFEYRSLIRIWFAQDSVQSGYHRHLQFAKQGENVASCDSAVDAVFML